ISEIQATDIVVRFQLAGDDPREQAALLRAIVQHGFEVKEFSCERRSLEDVFLQITTGAVQ
ncbi:MAG TPA: ABC transporter ATP-binding protein, partial [Planctomycetaceae bacterium]|nr:ABC transporter ATP-binding protein [Planctomycetaceae bacterium]